MNLSAFLPTPSSLIGMTVGGVAVCGGTLDRLWVDLPFSTSRSNDPEISTRHRSPLCAVNPISSTP